MRNKRAILVPTLTLALLCAPTAFAHGNAGPGQAHAKTGKRAVVDVAQSRVIGTAQSVLADLTKQNLRVATTYNFVSSSGQAIPVNIKNIYLKDGKYSLDGGGTGKGRSTQGVTFLLKGDATKTYGWVALPDEGIAYMYTSNAAGEVTVRREAYEKVYPICDIHYPKESALPEPKSSSIFDDLNPHIGDYPEGTDVNKLQSKPGSEYVFFMDISDIMNGAEPVTLSSKEEVWKTWQSLASSMSMFEINVTTDREIYDSVPVTNSGIARFLNQDGRSNSPLGAFGTTMASTNYKNQEEGYGLGRTAAHEVGHTMGLLHDGGSSQSDPEYFECLADYQWCPMMGNYWYGSRWEEPLYQYSKGEYSTATNQEDDLEIVSGFIPFREDDIPASRALEIGAGGEVDPLKNRGQIAANTDTDEFTFTVSGKGHASLKINRIEYMGGSMLDVQATLKGSGGDTIAESNLPVNRNAEIDVDLEAGEYTLVVEGGAEGTPQDGFSKYASLGFYDISGTIEGAGGDDDDDDDDSTDTDTSEETGETSSEETDSEDSSGDDDDDDDDDDGDTTTTGDDDDDDADDDDDDASSSSGETDSGDDDDDDGDDDDDDDDASETGEPEDDGGGGGGCSIDATPLSALSLVGLGLLGLLPRRRSRSGV